MLPRLGISVSILLVSGPTKLPNAISWQWMSNYFLKHIRLGILITQKKITSLKRRVPENHRDCSSKFLHISDMGLRFSQNMKLSFVVFNPTAGASTTEFCYKCQSMAPPYLSQFGFCPPHSCVSPSPDTANAVWRNSGMSESRYVEGGCWGGSRYVEGYWGPLTWIFYWI